MKKFLFLFLISIVLFSCARVGSPVGGSKDTIAPNFLGSNLDSARVNVPTSLKELRLDFDEYITLKEIQKNLNISPPIQKIKRILPSSLGNKFILIQWDDSLQANTTYNFNFGNAIADLNEGNVLPYFNYAFSTGDKLDELYISGEVKDGLAKTDEKAATKKNYVVGLYKASDSVDYRKKPYYLTKADADGYYELNYLSPGTYRIVAFDDDNQNSVMDLGKEAVAFRKEPVVLDKSISGLNLSVYPTKKAVKQTEIKEIPGGILMLFEGKPTKVEVLSVTDKLNDYKVTHQPKSDSVNVLFDAKKLNLGQDQMERIQLSYDADGKKDTVQYSYRYNKTNELTISNAKSNVFAPNQDFVISANMPVEKIQPEKWTLKSDSITRDFTAKISETNPKQIIVSSAFEVGKKYQLTVPKNTVSSFYEVLPKSYQFNFEIDKAENYGSITLNLENKPAQKFWLQFLSEKNEIAFQRFTDAAQNKFTEIKPGKYTIRILVDNNGNGFWDEADVSNETSAEDVYLFPKNIEIRPLWENVETWNLNEQSPVTSSSTTPTPPVKTPK
ncbi:Ig-like domain-containing domain [uncultured Chryseobacterium sp.]|uniref:Ig-like domain-containing domain n=1 Tax=uncultured Chryseobacterium sp. TaxID=259322 RepID=UPI002607ACC7|nr:Ig-like domain-containing domain [uncultured Chryseobacterium sp.]